MTNMPERIWIWEHDEDCSRTYSVPGEPYPTGSPEYRHADAPLTPAEAMARCPEVAALVGACSNVIWAKHGKHIKAALAPFTEDAGNDISPRNGPKPGY